MAIFGEFFGHILKLGHDVTFWNIVTTNSANHLLWLSKRFLQYCDPQKYIHTCTHTDKHFEIYIIDYYMNIWFIKVWKWQILQTKYRAYFGATGHRIRDGQGRSRRSLRSRVPEHSRSFERNRRHHRRLFFVLQSQRRYGEGGWQVEVSFNKV